jgi:hypothetical protein
MRILAHSIRINPENSVILVTAAAVAVLSLLDVIEDIRTLITVTLTVLSLMAFSTVRQSAAMTARETDQPFAEIPSDLIQTVGFDSALADSSFWHFRGCMGSYLRGQTLPRMAQAAKKHAASRSRITVQLLDPANEQVCEKYANYRRRLEEQRLNGPDASWTRGRVQLECMASLLAATWFHQHENLRIEIGMLDRLSSLRYDISDQMAITTNENPRFPAFVIRKSSQMYYAIISDLEISLESSRIGDLTALPQLPRLPVDITTEKLHECMSLLGVTRTITDLDRDTIVQLAFDQKRDYSIH